MLKTNVYIDGFNLYYGCLKGTAFKWLDLAQLSARLLPTNYQLNRILYFTARVRGRPHDPNAPTRQQIYLRALATIPNLSITYGHFLSSTIRMPLATPAPGGPATVPVIKTEEKGSDVNLASHLLLDTFKRDCEAALVISNDSDLLEPIRIVRHEFGLPVGIASPHPQPSQVLQKQATFVRSIRTGTLRTCQFPATLTDAVGTFTKPPTW
jgi:hypothetical protein